MIAKCRAARAYDTESLHLQEGQHCLCYLDTRVIQIRRKIDYEQSKAFLVTIA